MKTVLAAAFLSGVVATSAFAQQARVPTGIDVRGTTYYDMVGNRVVQRPGLGCTVRAVNSKECVSNNSEKTPAADATGAGGDKGGRL